MGGPVTYSRIPFASTVTVSDNNGGSPLTGVTPTLSPLEADAKIFENDDLDNGTPEGRNRAENYVKRQINSGAFNQKSVEDGDARTPSQTDNTNETPTDLEPANCDAIHSGFDFATLIAPSITLGNFIKDYPAIPACKQKSVPAQLGLQPDQIVCNLSQLANNIWLPLKQQYPDVIMTNSLRVGSAIGGGSHGTGQGMDVQFISSGQQLPPSEYFKRAQWVKSNLPFDQLILEYSTARGSLIAWLHISIYKDTGIKTNQTNRLLTMMNHRIKSTGLSNLG